MNYEYNISDSIYQNIVKIGKGGAILIDSGDVILRIYSCRFEQIAITDSGGARYLNTTYNNIQGSFFYRTCSSGRNNDRIVGNALYIVNGESVFNNNEVSSCGYEPNQCTDSSIRFNVKCELTNYNATSNIGRYGGAGFSLRYEPNSLIQYINIVDSHDDHACENQAIENKFEFMNVIKSEECNLGTIYLTVDNVLTLENCIFIDPHQIFTTPKTVYKAINCYSNVVINSFTQTDNPITQKIDIILNFNTKTLTSKIPQHLKVNGILFMVFIL